MPIFKTVMNWSDLTIIYLALGAPIGVYYFLRQPRKNFAVCFKSILVTATWIFFALTWRRTNRRNFVPRDAAHLENRIAAIQQNLNECAARNSSVALFFEWRETLERFVGLSFAARENADAPTAAETEFSRFSDTRDKILNARCLRRRNRKLLFFHHTLARKDFLQAFDALAATISEPETFRDLSLELAALLEDEMAGAAIAKMSRQTASAAVNSQEKVLWNTAPTFTPTIILSNAPPMRTNLSVKD